MTEVETMIGRLTNHTPTAIASLVSLFPCSPSPSLQLLRRQGIHHPFICPRRVQNTDLIRDKLPNHTFRLTSINPRDRPHGLLISRIITLPGIALLNLAVRIRFPQDIGNCLATTIGAVRDIALAVCNFGVQGGEEEEFGDVTRVDEGWREGRWGNGGAG